MRWAPRTIRRTIIIEAKKWNAEFCTHSRDRGKRWGGWAPLRMLRQRAAPEAAGIVLISSVSSYRCLLRLCSYQSFVFQLPSACRSWWRSAGLRVSVVHVSCRSRRLALLLSSPCFCRLCWVCKDREKDDSWVYESGPICCILLLHIHEHDNLAFAIFQWAEAERRSNKRGIEHNGIPKRDWISMQILFSGTTDEVAETTCRTTFCRLLSIVLWGTVAERLTILTLIHHSVFFMHHVTWSARRSSEKTEEKLKLRANTRPIIANATAVSCLAGRHPEVEKSTERLNTHFVEE